MEENKNKDKKAEGAQQINVHTGGIFSTIVSLASYKEIRLGLLVVLIAGAYVLATDPSTVLQKDQEKGFLRGQKNRPTQIDTVFKVDTIAIVDTVVVNSKDSNKAAMSLKPDTVRVRDTVRVVDTLILKDTIKLTLRDTIKVRDTVKIRDTMKVTVKDTVKMLKKDTVEVIRLVKNPITKK